MALEIINGMAGGHTHNTAQQTNKNQTQTLLSHHFHMFLWYKKIVHNIRKHYNYAIIYIIFCTTELFCGTLQLCIVIHLSQKCKLILYKQ